MTAVTDQCWCHHCWQNGSHDATGWDFTEKMLTSPDEFVTSPGEILIHVNVIYY